MAINDDIMMLRKFVENRGEKQHLEKNDLTIYGSGDNIFPWTNEALRGYYENDLTGKKVLSVTSSGDHILHAALAGAKEITGFDINRFCKYYSALKVAMVKAYNYDKFVYRTKQFCQCFSFGADSSKSSTSIIKHILSDVKKYLSKEEYIFWKTYAALKDKDDNLFVCGYTYSDLTRCNAYLNKEQYFKLKYNLNNCDIRYVDSSINNLKYKLVGKYDVIYLSNIISVIFPYERNEIYDVINSMEFLLSESGTIYDYHLHGIDYHLMMIMQNEVLRNTNFYSDAKKVINGSKSDEVYSYKKRNGSD